MEICNEFHDISLKNQINKHHLNSIFDNLNSFVNLSQSIVNKSDITESKKNDIENFVTTTRKYFTLKNMDNQNILAKAALIVTVMLCILSLMLFFLQHVLCSILMIVLMTMIIVLLFLFKTPEQVALVSIKHNLQPHMCNDLP